MSDSEVKIADERGKFALVVKKGRKLTDAAWQSGRVVLSNRRLVLVSGNGKKAIPLTAIEGIGDRYDVNERIATETSYVSLELGERVLLVTADDETDLAWRLYVALLDGATIMARHPAVRGGVVQDTEWEEARLDLSQDALTVNGRSGTQVDVALDDVATVETEERTVEGESRAVIQVEHCPDEDIVQTYLAGQPRQVSFMESLFAESMARHEADLDLTRTDEQVLMALYSGVSPFEIPDFTGMSIEEVEETFDRLIDLDALEEVRERREVSLTSQGRNVASVISNEE